MPPEPNPTLTRLLLLPLPLDLWAARVAATPAEARHLARQIATEGDTPITRFAAVMSSRRISVPKTTPPIKG